MICVIEYVRYNIIYREPVVDLKARQYVSYKSNKMLVLINEMNEILNYDRIKHYI